VFYEKHHKKKLEVVSSTKNNCLNPNSIKERNQNKISDISENEKIECIELWPHFRTNEFIDKRKPKKTKKYFFIDAYSRNSYLELEKNAEKYVKRKDNQKCFEKPMKRSKI
jgi:hypothetical protein